jgi:hypothetical protein
LRRVIESFPEAKRLVPELRMVVVVGPRIDPDALPRHEGLEVSAYVRGLYRHLAANRRAFLYFPLKHHFEQQFHVPYRLARYGAGRRMHFDTSPTEAIAAAIAEEIGREVSTRPMEADGAARAAAMLSELLQ